MPYDWMTQQQLLLQRIAHTSGRGQHQLQLQQKVLNRLLPVQGTKTDEKQTKTACRKQSIPKWMNAYGCYFRSFKMSRCQPRIMAPGIRWTRPSIIQSSSRLANCLRATGFLKAKSTQFLLDRQRWQDVVELWWVFLFLLGHSFSSRLIRMPAASKMSMALINASHLQASCVHVFLDMTDTNMLTY